MHDSDDLPTPVARWRLPESHLQTIASIFSDFVRKNLDTAPSLPVRRSNVCKSRAASLAHIVRTNAESGGVHDLKRFLGRLFTNSRTRSLPWQGYFCVQPPKKMNVGQGTKLPLYFFARAIELLGLYATEAEESL